MEIKVINDIDMFAEAMTLLQHLAEGEDPLDKMRELIQKYEISPEKVEKPFTVSARIHELGREKLSKDMEKVKHYFTPIKEDDMLNLGTLAVLWSMLEIGETIESRKKYCLSLTEEERSWEFYISLLSGIDMTELEDQNALDKGMCRSLWELLLHLDKADFTIEQKWQIQWIFTHYEQAFEEVELLLGKAYEALEETKELWQPLQEEFYHYWLARLQKKTLAEYLMEQLNYTLEENENGGLILPWITGTNQFAMSGPPVYRGGKRTGKDICRIGTMLEHTGILTAAVSPSAQKKHVASVLKLLSDESKLEILTLLKEKSYYGGELAQKVNLTTATISHHMSTLLTSGLITVSKDKNRIYYGLNEKNIRDILDQVKGMLLKET